MAKVLIGLGTNMGLRESNLQDAIHAFSLVPDISVVSASPVFETAPIGYADQQDFYNAVLMIETELSPHAILGVCLGIEATMGRKRQIKNGPRVLDLDVLIYENVRLDTHELTVPHPRMLERRFVLQPMKELFPAGRALGVTFTEELQNVQDQEIRPTGLRLEV